VPPIEVPSLPPVSAPEPVERVLPAVGDVVDGASGGGSSGGPISDVGGAVRGSVEGALGGDGSSSGSGAGRVTDGVGGTPGMNGSRGGAGTAGPGGGSAGAAGVAVVGAVGRRAAAGGRAGSPSHAGRQAARNRAIERRRGRLVRRRRGCLDVLPGRQRATLILRYGVGPLRARSRRDVARVLDVARERVRVLERLGARRLAGLGKEADCVGTGVSLTTLVAVYELLTDTTFNAFAVGLHAPLEQNFVLAGAAAAAVADGEGGVAGARETARSKGNGTPRPDEDGPASSAGPSLGDPFGTAKGALDDPAILVLLAIVVASLISAGREIRRAVR
jgi:Sigma-70, region 4